MGVAEDLRRIGIDLNSQRARVATALRYVASYYRDDLTTAGIAAVSGYSERGLQDALLRDIGMNPTQLIIRLRLEEARSILVHGLGEMTVSEVADLVNLPHKGRFSSRYRELFGETPSQTMRSRGAAADWVSRR